MIGKIYIVGLGPGGIFEMTNRAEEVLEGCDIIVGYTVYVDLIREDFKEKTFLATGMKQEVDRCKIVLEEALKGKKVAMVCSGDAGVYGMAGIVHEVAKDHPEVEIEVIPGVTAACSAAAVLGAPLIHDFVMISLSDLLTSWETIEKRIALAAQADFVICFYNPSSRKRHDYLEKACKIIMEYERPETVAGYVQHIGREGQNIKVCTLEEMVNAKVDMFTTVIIGNSETKVINGKMVTPRGYEKHYDV
nr:precorrin-3B C(17)-methyltransferase [Holtiella tumoricola]